MTAWDDLLKSAEWVEVEKVLGEDGAPTITHLCAVRIPGIARDVRCYRFDTGRVAIDSGDCAAMLNLLME